MGPGERSFVTAKGCYTEGSSAHKQLPGWGILYFHIKSSQTLTQNKVNATSSSHMGWPDQSCARVAPIYFDVGRWGQRRSDRGSKCLEKDPVSLWQVLLCKKYKLQRKAGAWGKQQQHGYVTSHPHQAAKQTPATNGDVCKVKIYDTLYFLVPWIQSCDMWLASMWRKAKSPKKGKMSGVQW